MQWPSRLVEGIGIRVIFMKRCPLAGRTKEPAANWTVKGQKPLRCRQPTRVVGI